MNQPQPPNAQAAKTPDDAEKKNISIDLGEIMAKMSDLHGDLVNASKLIQAKSIAVTVTQFETAVLWFQQFVAEMKSSAIEEQKKKRIITP